MTNIKNLPVETDQYGKFINILIAGVPTVFREIPAGTVKPLVGNPITVEKPFWCMDTTCTLELWEAVMGYRPRGYGASDVDTKTPVVYVSYFDVKDFLVKVNELIEGGRFDLPTSEEWMYSCRAGATTLYNNNRNDITREEAAFYDEDYPELTGPVPVRSYPPNAWGLYEMHGNVWECTKSPAE